MSTANKLTYLNTTKQNIKTAINNAGANITNDTFRSYATTLGNRITKMRTDYDTALSYLPKDTKTNTSVSITNAVDLPTYSFKLTKESTQDTIVYIDDGVWEQGNINGSTGENESNSSRVRTQDYIPIKSGVLYTLTRTISTNYNTYRFYDSSKNYIGNNTNINLTSSLATTNMQSGDSTQQITINDTNVAYLRIVDTNNNLSISYTISTTDTPSPNYPQEVKTVKGYRNLFDKDNKNVFKGFIVQTSGDNRFSSATNWSSVYIAIEGGKTYTVTKVQSQAFRLATSQNIPTDNGTLTNKIIDNSATTLTITAGASDNYLTVSGYNSSTDTLTEQQILDSIMIVEGNNILPYVPYGTNWIYTTITDGTNTRQIPLPLNDNEICGIGDYKDEYIVDKYGHCYLNKKTGKSVLNGSENNWYKSSISSINRFANSLNRLGINLGYSGGLCSHFTVKTTLDSTYPDLYLSTQNNDLYIDYSEYSTMTATDFTTWLSTHNINVYYVLATANLIDLNYTVDMTLYEGINNITNSETAPMEITYVEDINTILATLFTPENEE